MATPNPNGNEQGAANNIITALGNAFKTQTGDPLPGDRIAQLLLQNMGQLSDLVKQGKLNQTQIIQLKEYADKHKASALSSSLGGTPVPAAHSSPVPTQRQPQQHVPQQQTQVQTQAQAGPSKLRPRLASSQSPSTLYPQAIFEVERV